MERCIDRLKGKYERKKGVKDDLKVLTQAIKRMELLLIEVVETEKRAWGKGGILLVLLGCYIWC